MAKQRHPLSNVDENLDKILVSNNAVRISPDHAARKPISSWFIFAVLLSITVLIFFFNVFQFDFITSYYSQHQLIYDPMRLPRNPVHQCEHNHGPIFYNLKTSMGVSYEGGHWFHMAENFMTHHSIRRKKIKDKIISAIKKEKSFSDEIIDDLLPSDYSEVFFNFDNKKFIKSLNGVTKFFVALGSSDFTSQINPNKTKINILHYVHVPNNVRTPEIKTLRQNGKFNTDYFGFSKFVVGDTFMLQSNSLESQQTENLSFTEKENVAKLFVSGVINSKKNDFFVHEIKENSLIYKKYQNTETFIDNEFASNKTSKMEEPRSKFDTKSRTLSKAINNTFLNDFDTNNKKSAVCVKFMGNIGGNWPTPQRGHWFPNEGDVESFRMKMKTLCPANKELIKDNEKKKKYKMVIYQRDISRKLIDQDNAIKLIFEKLSPELWDIQILMHTRDRSPCSLAHTLHNTDVLITPHGFQSMLLLFLPRPSIIFEIFPYRYYKRGYGPLGGEYGTIHGGVMSPSLRWHSKLILSLFPTSYCMLSKMCREYSRGDNVRLTAHGANKLVKLINTNIHKFTDKNDQKSTRDYLY